MALELLKEKLEDKLDKINRYKNSLDVYFGVALINKDTDKIGFFISSFIHLLIILVAIGIPSCFQPKTITVPNIIPIEILNVDEVTNIPLDPEKEIEKKEKKEKEIKESKQIKFASNNQTEIAKIQDSKDQMKDVAKINEIIPKKQEILEKKPKKPIIEEKKIEDKVEFESLPTKKIKPKIKPKPKIQEQEDTDIVVKIKSKPAPKRIFNISSVLKDLRNENIQTNIQDNDKDSSESSKDEKEKKSNNFTISEIDLLKQQLYGCWTVPAGAKGASDMVVKVRVWVNPDRTVSNARILDTNLMQSNPYFRTVAESALRAVLNPACSPLKLPPEKYDVWKKFIFKFELGWMLGN